MASRFEPAAAGSFGSPSADLRWLAVVLLLLNRIEWLERELAVAESGFERASAEVDALTGGR